MKNGVRPPFVSRAVTETALTTQPLGVRDVTGTSCSSVDMTGGGYVDAQLDKFQDEFRIKIPGEKQEHLIPGSCVRSVELTVIDVVSAYANSLNISANQLDVLDMDLTQVFTDIRREFSVECFREEVRAEAADFVFPEEVLSRD